MSVGGLFFVCSNRYRSVLCKGSLSLFFCLLLQKNLYTTCTGKQGFIPHTECSGNQILPSLTITNTRIYLGTWWIITNSERLQSITVVANLLMFYFDVPHHVSKWQGNSWRWKLVSLCLWLIHPEIQGPKCISFHHLIQLFCLYAVYCRYPARSALRCTVCVMHNKWTAANGQELELPVGMRSSRWQENLTAGRFGLISQHVIIALNLFYGKWMSSILAFVCQTS